VGPSQATRSIAVAAWTCENEANNAMTVAASAWFWHHPDRFLDRFKIFAYCAVFEFQGIWLFNNSVCQHPLRPSDFKLLKPEPYSPDIH
jgi:hypothetical protein